jgi:hypothetical protein
MILLILVTNTHVPIKKITVKTVKSLWIDELKDGLVERDEAKGKANNSGCTTDWQTYCKLINHVSKLTKNKLHYKTKNHTKNDSNKLWSTLINDILGKKMQTLLHHSLNQLIPHKTH